MAIFIFDFDDTILDGNMSNIITQVINTEFLKDGKSPTSESTESQWNLVKHILPIGNKALWEKQFKKILEQRHHIAIASFNPYGLIQRYLSEVLELSQDLIKQIFVNSWMPKNPNSANKNEHIKEIIKHYKYEGYAASVVLIDNDFNNLYSAYLEDHSVIEANQNGDHLKYVDVILSNIFSSSNYNAFCKLQDQEAYGVVYGKEFERYLRSLEFGTIDNAKEDDETASTQRQGFYLIPEKLLDNATKELKNSFMITENYAMYFIDRKGVREQYNNINKSELKKLFDQHQLLELFSQLTSEPLEISDKIPNYGQLMTEINQLIINASFATSTSATTTTTSNANKEESAEVFTSILGSPSSPTLFAKNQGKSASLNSSINTEVLDFS